MASIYDIYERKNYRNIIRLDNAVNFEVEVRETRMKVQAKGDYSSQAKDSVFRYRYQIEEYLRQHPSFRESPQPIQIYASAPEIVRYVDLASRLSNVAPMSCMSGAMADFVGRDLLAESTDLVVSSGGDTFIRSSVPLNVIVHAKGSKFHERLQLSLPPLKNCFGVSTYVPGKGIHSVTVVSRSACWASAYALDIGTRLEKGSKPTDVFERAETYRDVGGLIVVAGAKIVVGGELTVTCSNGQSG